MKEKIISEINLDLVFQCNDFSQFSNKLKDTKTKLILEIIFSFIYSYTGIFGLPIMATSIKIPIKTRKVIEK